MINRICFALIAIVHVRLVGGLELNNALVVISKMITDNYQIVNVCVLQTMLILTAYAYPESDIHVKKKDIN